MKELTKSLKTIFGVGIFASLILGGIALVAFIIAMFCDASTGEAVAVFIKNSYFPCIIRFTTVIVLIGFILTYLDKSPKKK